MVPIKVSFHLFVLSGLFNFICKVEVLFNMAINMTIRYRYHVPSRYDFTRLLDYYAVT